jgi:hypothetical protein
VFTRGLSVSEFARAFQRPENDRDERASERARKRERERKREEGVRVRA